MFNQNRKTSLTTWTVTYYLSLKAYNSYFHVESSNSMICSGYTFWYERFLHVFINFSNLQVVLDVTGSGRTLVISQAGIDGSETVLVGHSVLSLAAAFYLTLGKRLGGTQSFKEKREHFYAGIRSLKHEDICFKYFWRNFCFLYLSIYELACVIKFLHNSWYQMYKNFI